MSLPAEQSCGLLQSRAITANVNYGASVYGARESYLPLTDFNDRCFTIRPKHLSGPGIIRYGNQKRQLAFLDL